MFDSIVIFFVKSPSSLSVAVAFNIAYSKSSPLVKVYVSSTFITGALFFTGAVYFTTYFYKSQVYKFKVF